MARTDEQKAKHAEYMRKWNADHKEVLKDRQKGYKKKYVNKHRERVSAANKDYKIRNADKIALYNQATKEESKERSKKYYYHNKEKALKSSKERYERNKDEVLRINKEWKEKNREHYRKQQAEYKRNRLKIDPVFYFIETARRRMLNALKGVASKSARTLDLLGCSGAEAVAHIESQFKDGMNWGNRHSWHIDHIRPLVSFDLTKADEQRSAFHYTNLQPLWATENRSKGSKILSGGQ